MVRMELDERRTEGVGTLDRCGPCRIIELEMEMRTVGAYASNPVVVEQGGARLDGQRWRQFSEVIPPLRTPINWADSAAYHP